jgi:hypothetical protein
MSITHALALLFFWDMTLRNLVENNKDLEKSSASIFRVQEDCSSISLSPLLHSEDGHNFYSETFKVIFEKVLISEDITLRNTLYQSVFCTCSLESEELLRHLWVKINP